MIRGHAFYHQHGVYFQTIATSNIHYPLFRLVQQHGCWVTMVHYWYTQDHDTSFDRVSLYTSHHHAWEGLRGDFLHVVVVLDVLHTLVEL